MERSLPLAAKRRLYLHFCRTEKGLSENSLSSYRRDLEQFERSIGNVPLKSISLETLRQYVDTLSNEQGLSKRSIARHVSTLRGWFAFLVDEGDIPSNPAETLVIPKTGTNLPKFLERRRVDELLSSPTADTTTGLRDRAILDL